MSRLHSAWPGWTWRTVYWWLPVAVFIRRPTGVRRPWLLEVHVGRPQACWHLHVVTYSTLHSENTWMHGVWLKVNVYIRAYTLYNICCYCICCTILHKCKFQKVIAIFAEMKVRSVLYGHYWSEWNAMPESQIRTKKVKIIKILHHNTFLTWTNLTVTWTKINLKNNNINDSLSEMS